MLSIAGFDPSSGAGITADIKTIAAHGCYGATCITALTVQTTQGVRAVEAVKPEIIRATLRELAADLSFSAVRIGMLGSAAVVEAVSEFLESTRPPNVVLDPVVRSSSGAELLEAAGVALLKRRLLPLVSVVTPNVDEVAVLSGLWPPSRAGRSRASRPGSRAEAQSGRCRGRGTAEQRRRGDGGYGRAPGNADRRALVAASKEPFRFGFFLPGKSNRARLTAQAVPLPPRSPVLWRLEFRFLKQ